MDAQERGVPRRAQLLSALIMWHCPHCGAPQAETARCWVCRKSSTTCSTCRHFRPSLVSDIGYCALDRARRPLTGRELRGCWTQRPGIAQPDDAARPAGAAGQSPSREPLPVRGFIPLDEVVPLATPLESPGAPPISLLADALDAGDVRTSLFGELDR
jgi:hypothetical protein